jgi:hypothetical protein
MQELYKKGGGMILKNKNQSHKYFWRYFFLIITILQLTSCAIKNEIQNTPTVNAKTSTSIPVVTPTMTEVPTTAVSEETIEPNLYPIQLLPTGTPNNSISWAILLHNSWPTMSMDHKWGAFSIYRIDENSDYKENIWIFTPSDSKGFFLFSKDEDLGYLPSLHFSTDGKYLVVATRINIQLFTTNNWQKIKDFSYDRNKSGIVWSPQNNAFFVPDSVFRDPETGVTLSKEKNNPILLLQQITGTKSELLQVKDIYPNELPDPEIAFLYLWGPDWSPDGNKIAYIKYYIDPLSNRMSEKSELWILDITSGQKIKLCEGGFFSHPVWSPDGNKIAIEGFDYKNSINEIQIYDFQSKTLNNYDGDIGKFDFYYDQVWSPDAQNIAVCLETNDKKNLYLINVNTGIFKLIETGEIFPIVWTNDNFLFSYEWMYRYNAMELMDLNE